MSMYFYMIKIIIDLIILKLPIKNMISKKTDFTISQKKKKKNKKQKKNKKKKNK